MFIDCSGSVSVECQCIYLYLCGPVFFCSICFIFVCILFFLLFFFFFFKQKTAYEMRISDWSSDVCSSDLLDSWYQLWVITRIQMIAPLSYRIVILSRTFSYATFSMPLPKGTWPRWSIPYSASPPSLI